LLESTGQKKRCWYVPFIAVVHVLLYGPFVATLQHVHHS